MKKNLKVVKELLVDKINADPERTLTVTLDSFEYLPESYLTEKVREIRIENMGDKAIYAACVRYLRSLNTSKY